MLKELFEKLKIDEFTPLVIGCSTGPDSMALLHYLQNNTKNKLIVAHVNHGLRKESEKEEKYIKDYCKKNKLTLEIYHINKYEKNNIESEAREKRYNFYNTILEKYNTQYLFLAHHGDDLIETVLMKINRGSNLEGYAGIKEISTPNKFRNYYIIRPFIRYTKENILNYNEKYNIKYFIDESNNDTNYTRNRFRKNILPLLKQENKDIHRMFLNYSKTLQEYDKYIKYETETIIKDVYQNNILNIDNFKNHHPFMQKQILYKILTNIYNDNDNIIKDNHIESILKAINNTKPNIKLNLPNNLSIVKEYNNLKFLKDKNETKENFKQEFKDIYENEYCIIRKIDSTSKDGNDICKLNSKNIKFPLYIRNRKDGDKIELLNINKHKKVKEIFIENKIPPNKRNSFPLLVDANDNILWIPNIKKTKFNAKKNEFYDIIIEYCERKENNE